MVNGHAAGLVCLAAAQGLTSLLRVPVVCGFSFTWSSSLAPLGTASWQISVTIANRRLRSSWVLLMLCKCTNPQMQNQD